MNPSADYDFLIEETSSGFPVVVILCYENEPDPPTRTRIVGKAAIKLERELFNAEMMYGRGDVDTLNRAYNRILVRHDPRKVGHV